MDNIALDGTDDAVKSDTVIEAVDIDAYYKEESNFTGYLKDADSQPIKNRTLKVDINGKTYEKITDDSGRVTLPVSLSANDYGITVAFDGDDKYDKSNATGIIKIRKVPLSIKVNDFSTYVDSDLFFTAKIINNDTNVPVGDINVQFKVYDFKTKKYSYYWGKTDDNGIVKLNKNLREGSYRVQVIVKDKSVLNARSKKVKMNVKATAETGCCSFYVQVSSTEGVAGFRRDSTYAADLYIKVSKWHGRTAIKQYKMAHTYFFHSITTSDGWMMGTGGADNPSINKAIENLAGKMVSEGKIQKSVLRKIQSYERSLGIGHFAIKAPNGKYAVVWKNGVRTGKLKAGEYISVPNSPYSFRHGAYDKFDANPAKATLKIGATDVFGVNRRDITVFHWKTTTKNYKTSSSVTVYAANDDGHMMGRHTSHLKDNIHFKDKYISKNSLPKVPGMKKLGTHKFGNIDKLVKTPTSVNAPEVSNKFNQSKFFKISVKDKKTKTPLKNIKIRVKFLGSNSTRTYTIKTDDNGIVRINTKKLAVGEYKVEITQANRKYLISAESALVIEE